MRRPRSAAAEPAAPLDPGEFAALLDRLGPFEPAPRLAVAVSGGPDSMALALLAAAWAGPRGGTVLALVVDHGLRPESPREAQQVCAWLARRGIAACLLAWTGPKPATGIQARARAARLELLLAACRSRAILHLLLAHQREDQAETVALREAAGSGAEGLAGMAAVREVHGLRLLRPLLAVPKARLVATLAAAEQPWLHDPSNTSPRFARGRLRASPDFAVAAAWARGSTAAAARTAADEAAAAALAALVRPDRLGFVRIAATDWSRLAAPVRAGLLARLLAAIGGRAYPVARAALARLSAAEIGSGATLGGCIIVRRGGDLLVLREPGRIRHRLDLPPGGSAHWDGRFLLRHERGPATLEIRALGPAGLNLLHRDLRRRLRAAAIPAVAVHALPAAWLGSDLIACPPLHFLGLNSSDDFSIVSMLQTVLPLAAAAFGGVNVVSNPQQPIYRRATARVLIERPAPSRSSTEPLRPTSRRTQ